MTARPARPPARHETEPPPRLFGLYRVEDVHAVSGTGLVAYGLEWADGQCVTRFAPSPGFGTPPISTWLRASDVQRIHGHGGKTRLIYLMNRAGHTQQFETAARAKAALTDYDAARARATGSSFAWLDPAMAALNHMPNLLERYEQMLTAHLNLRDEHEQLRAEYDRLKAEADAMQAHLDTLAVIQTEGTSQ